MSTITIECPESVLRSLHETRERFAEDIRVLAAVKLYELGRFSSGRAAELAGMSRLLFLHKLAEHGVPLYAASPAELSADLDVARLAANDRQGTQK
jgi:predicted HTH domain antitoxin